MKVAFKRIDKSSDDTDYIVSLEGVDESDKKTTLTSKQSYYKYSKGDIVTMQEVTYKYKGEIFSEIIFAKEKHYSRLNNYCQSNLHSDTEEDINEMIEQADNKAKTNINLYQNWKSQPSSVKFMFTTFLGMIFFGAQILMIILVLFL